MTPQQRKIISISAGIGAFLVAAFLVGFISDQFARRSQLAQSPFPGLDTVAFELPATTGGMVSNRDLMGKPSVIFYGFTHCPEVCPVTLYGLTEILDNLGAAPDALQMVFVTVDPERDTIPVLNEYITAINEHAIGLSGAPEALAEMRRGFGVYAENTPLEDGDYTMDHTATVYLYDAKGKIAGTIAWGEPYDFAEAKIRALIAAQ
ncbi:MAG: SCO family protein [Alphaproteobacteria bacterium]|nr:SCO family protein [Alphaproteobacteria bacterium]